MMDEANNDGGVRLLQAKGTKNEGHGHVFVRPDGVRARCGGASLCSQCSKDLAKLNQPFLQAAIAQHEGDENPVAWMSSLSELRERLRCEMLATKLTSGGDTYEDGFAQGLSHSIGAIDHILARFASTPATPTQMGKFKLGDRVRKTKGSSWQGRIVGFYSTDLTAEGYAVESEREPGSVQIYPKAALVFVGNETGDTSHAE